MIIELERRPLCPRSRIVLTMLALMLSLMGLAALGRVVTPHPARWLAWADWQALKVERRYHAELAALRAAVLDLRAVLESAPDPIQAGLLHDRLLHQLAKGLPELAVPRAAVLAANEAIYQWAIAAQSQGPALTALQVAVEAVR